MEIRMAGVSKIFDPDIVALEDVYLNVKKGEFVYFVGHTGSGKTTLLRLINRELIPTSGQIMVGKYNLRKLRLGQLPYYRRQIGVVFQDFKLLPHLNAAENVAFVLEAIGVPKRQVEERVKAVLSRLDLWRRRFLYPEQMSGGEQQRLAIARAVVNMPSLLIADEPTGNLDMETAESIMEILFSINATGTTVLMATHNQYIVDAFRARVVELDRGRIARDEPKGEVELYGDL
ncbi:MAG TPA: ATP-binding cassette domain-containing protein [Acetomicrobium flavidum]|uniref:Cell division transport system ATP-binding protein n=2 Tax=Acetomicrobium TaxID=49894 RepID=A0ABY1JBR6_9BACT|nr:ATP-binding cassette domain-containing protein [Acetomicrobium mobile]SIN64125.1 cell division transport system ATP-binding protein [Acetomicrobium flavidum]AFM21210.1 putative ATPase involved in cell division [Acetomicrobium mobile DSM 13181]HOJ82655.1 ATP-binding cassette domain-containing protein [Acetomicrobium flavidum]HOP88210.1 ATP-binding cassette domain-containing protein [Acetomicrobium flavidum]HPP14736.1 ATP-binding cassette domain-containing protein [Acetomicrobium flavidum]